MENTFISRLEWRFATKKFDTVKKVSPADMADILKAIRFAPSSLGLQPFKVYSIEDPQLRAKIKDVAYGQEQITDASHLLAFVVRTNVTDRIEEFKQLTTGGSEVVKAAMAEYFKMIEGFVSSLTGEVLPAWCAKQAYIALGFALAACAEKGIDSCPMEGFDASAVDGILGLPENERIVVMLPVGHRAEGPQYPKVRFPESDMFAVK